MNTFVLTLKRQPAVVDGKTIVVRKLWIQKTPATAESLLAAPDLVQGQDEYLRDVTWEELLGTDSPDFSVKLLQGIRLMHGISDEDAMVEFLQHPPRIYPVY